MSYGIVFAFEMTPSNIVEVSGKRAVAKRFFHRIDLRSSTGK
jgi:hypothetical protein